MVESSTLATVGPLRRRVEKMLEARGLTTKWLYDRIGMSKVGYRQMWERESIKVSTLLAIAAAFEVTVAELMGEQPAGALAEPAAAYGRPKYLEERVAELEAAVKQLRHDLRRKG